MFQTFANDSLCDRGLLSYRVDVLDLDQGLKILFKEPREKVLQLISSEVLKHVLPVRLFGEITKVWLHVTTQDSESR